MGSSPRYWLEHLLHREEPFDPRLLEDDADALAQSFSGARRVVAEDAELARVRGTVPLHDLDGGGLAGAVRAQQAEHLTATNAEVDAFQGLGFAIGLTEGPRLDDGGGHGVIVRVGGDSQRMRQP